MRDRVHKENYSIDGKASNLLLAFVVTVVDAIIIW